MARWELQSIKGANLKCEPSFVDCPHLPACQVAKHPHPTADPTLPRDPEWAQPARAHHAQEWHDADGRANGRDADGWRPQRDEHGAEAAAWTSHTACRSRVGTTFISLSYFCCHPFPTALTEQWKKAAQLVARQQSHHQLSTITVKYQERESLIQSNQVTCHDNNPHQVTNQRYGHIGTLNRGMGHGHSAGPHTLGPQGFMNPGHAGTLGRPPKPQNSGYAVQ